VTFDLGGAAIGAVSSFAVTGVLCVVARRRGWLDHPGARRMHDAPTPRVGGVGLLAGLLPALLLTGARGAAVTAGAYFAVGLLDDVAHGRHGLRARTKLLLQVAAGVVAVVGFDVRFAGRPSGPWGSVALAWAGPALTVAWLVAVVNLVNFTDGIDGISATTGAVLLGAAAGAGGPASGLAAAGLGGLAGFALWNAPPARAFLGDGGSHLLGALVALAPCAGTGVAATEAVPWALATAPLLPTIVDVGAALVRKVRRGVPLAVAHDDHLYQRLVKAGDPAGLVALRYGALALAAVALAGPVARRHGALAAVLAGAAVLGLHLATGARRTAGVPRTLGA
jgi:UDP-N-acetylmuramyl pentapeptide phosphotransferase/UDP-N-acetylglucosamine-1-phosphate transferase